MAIALTLLLATTGCATSRQTAALVVGTLGVGTAAGGAAVLANRPEPEPGERTSAAPEALIIGGLTLTAVAVGLLITDMDLGKPKEAWLYEALPSYEDGGYLANASGEASDDTSEGPRARRSARAERGDDSPSRRAAQPAATPPPRSPSEDVRIQVPAPPPKSPRATTPSSTRPKLPR